MSTESIKMRVEQLHMKRSDESNIRTEAQLEGIIQRLGTMPGALQRLLSNDIKSILMDQVAKSECTWVYKLY